MEEPSVPLNFLRGEAARRPRACPRREGFSCLFGGSVTAIKVPRVNEIALSLRMSERGNCFPFLRKVNGARKPERNFERIRGV